MVHPDRVNALVQEAKRAAIERRFCRPPSIRVRVYMIVFWLYRKLFGHDIRILG
jgi:hypothetical protein